MDVDIKKSKCLLPISVFGMNITISVFGTNIKRSICLLCKKTPRERKTCTSVKFPRCSGVASSVLFGFHWFSQMFQTKNTNVSDKDKRTL